MKLSRLVLAITLICTMLLVSACRNETQNRIRRSIQDYTSGEMFITLYSLDGSVVYEGVVDGKVTRSSTDLSNTSDKAAGSYIFWFDKNGRYHQSDLPYLVTSYDRAE